MIRWTITFLIISLMAFGLSFASNAVVICRVVGYLFLVFFVLSILTAAARGFKD